MGGTRLPGEAELLQALPALNAIDPGEPTKMPLEARMYGIFAAFFSTWLLALVMGRGRAAAMPPPWLLVTFVAFVAVMGFDGANATLYDLNMAGLPIPYLYAPRLDARLASGILSGTGMAGIMLPIVNYALWRNATPQRVFQSAADLATLLIWNAILFVVVVSGSGLFFYPASFLGVLGVIALLAIINLVMLLSALNRNGVATRWRETLNPFAAALLISMLELGALSLVRYAILGTAVLP
ncbi:MAG: DUF2085 domain-containing protein [Anaerolineae bacterium]